MSRISVLDLPADLKAEKGTPTWARGVAAKIRVTAGKLDTDVESVQEWVQIAAEEKAWIPLGYASLDLFLVAETGITQSFLDAIRAAKNCTVGDVAQKVQEAKEKPANTHGGDRKSKDQACSTSLKHGTAEHTLARLARDGHEELLDQIANKEISINKAAIEVGYRKQKSEAEKCVASFRKTDKRLETLRTIVNELEAYEVEVLKQMLEDHHAITN